MTDRELAKLLMSANWSHTRLEQAKQLLDAVIRDVDEMDDFILRSCGADPGTAYGTYLELQDEERIGPGCDDVDKYESVIRRLKAMAIEIAQDEAAGHPKQ